MDTDDQTLGFWQNHTAGISAILHLRGKRQCETEIGRHILRWTNAQLSIKDCAYGTNLVYNDAPLTIFPRNGSAVVWHILCAFMTLVRRRQALYQSRFENPHLQADIQTLAEEIPPLVQRWEGISTEDFEPKFTTVKTFFMAGSPTVLTQIVHCFSSYSNAVVWTNYWMLKHRMTKLHLECTRAPQPSRLTDDLLVQEDILLSQLAESADNIAGALAYFLGLADDPDQKQPADPYQVKGSIPRVMFGTVCCNILIGTLDLESQRPGMRRWCLDCLAQIASIYGIKQAAVFRKFWTRVMALPVSEKRSYGIDPGPYTGLNANVRTVPPVSSDAAAVKNLAVRSQSQHKAGREAGEEHEQKFSYGQSLMRF